MGEPAKRLDNIIPIVPFEEVKRPKTASTSVFRPKDKLTRQFVESLEGWKQVSHSMDKVVLSGVTYFFSYKGRLVKDLEAFYAGSGEFEILVETVTSGNGRKYVYIKDLESTDIEYNHLITSK